LKLARNANGRRCNRFEADLWARTTEVRRNMLCPVFARFPFGFALIMQRAKLHNSGQVAMMMSSGRGRQC
jgi:hypothetical protein